MTSPEPGKPLSETWTGLDMAVGKDLSTVMLYLRKSDYDDLAAKITHQAAQIRAFTDRIQSRLEQHQENLRLWKSGYLNPTEPDEEERARIKRGLEGAIYELEELLKQYPLSGTEEGKGKEAKP